jgi:hypothetical protein
MSDQQTIFADAVDYDSLGRLGELGDRMIEELGLTDPIQVTLAGASGIKVAEFMRRNDDVDYHADAETARAASQRGCSLILRDSAGRMARADLVVYRTRCRGRVQ